MANSKHIAKLLGPTLIVMTISEVMNAHIWASVSVTQTYLAGSLWFVAGLSIILAHNRWMFDWTIIVTLMGWFIMLGGLGRMFFPESAQQGSGNASLVLVVQAVLLAIGIVLTYKAFSRGDH